jgi:hypothetical protein
MQLRSAEDIGRMRGLAMVALAVTLDGTIAVAQGSDEPAVLGAQSQSLDYLVINQPIADVFAMIERDTGLRIMTTEAVRGRIEQHRLTGPTETALRKLAVQQDLDLFVYNGTVHVSARSEAALRLVGLDGIPADRAKAALEQAGLNFAPDTLRIASDGNSLSLSGPPRMLAIAEAVIEGLPPIGAIPPQVASVRVRRAGQLQVETIGQPQPPSQETETTEDTEQVGDG